MLSTINAAEILFRHESESRAREHALLASIRERHHGDATLTTVGTSALSIAPPTRSAARATQLTWPRPIGVERCETAGCAVA